MSTILLVDNGSRRANATQNLRRLAGLLSERTGQNIHPVSLQHADKIPADKLDGNPALTFEPFMRSCLENGERDFIVLPLFFGPSRALSRFIPDHVETFKQEFGEFNLRVTDVLCPLPKGEPRLTKILHECITGITTEAKLETAQVILVDHGSPIPEVTAVRNQLAEELRKLLDKTITLSEAVMERREGKEYDFNGVLLEDLMKEYAEQKPDQAIILSMLFLLPGRHAGHGGDIDAICHSILQDYPQLKIYMTPLVGDHPGIIDILQLRLEECLQG
ncbi:MAG: CbiX/SirB N-terminal domain-containing protein [Gammaproteobacteria bacterium]|nr:CbiX/SirB N-terminal domain-containing protein [Gammaproteobacteria bacterium]